MRMTVTTEDLIVAGLALLVLLLAAYLVGSRVRAASHKPAGSLPPVTLPPGAEALAPAFAELRGQLGDLRGQLEELRRAEAAEQVRRTQEDQAWQAIQRVETSLGQLGGVPGLQQSLQEQIAAALRDLANIKELQAAESQRWSREDDAFGKLQSLAAVLLGSSTSGAVGERVVEQMIEALPPQWRVTDHRVNGKTVEFAVRLPDGLFLPIDSKVVAQTELGALDHEQDPARRAQLEREIQAKVLGKAGEVRKYVDARSVGFAIAAVPDSLYRLSGPILPRAYQEHRALLVPYSLLAPFVLMVYEQHHHAGNLDTAQLGRLLSDTQRHLEGASGMVNGDLSSALVRLTNARDRLTRELASAASALEQLQASSPQPAGASRNGAA
jgi:hypothetical protein